MTSVQTGRPPVAIRDSASNAKSAQPSSASLPQIFVGLVAATIGLDLVRFGLAVPGGISAKEALVRVSVFLGPPAIFALLTDRSVLAMFRRPVLWLTLTFAWGMFTAPLALSPAFSILSALSFAGVTMTGAWTAERDGWMGFVAALATGLTVFLGIGALGTVSGFGPESGIQGLDSSFLGFERFIGFGTDPSGVGLAASLCAFAGLTLWWGGPATLSIRLLGPAATATGGVCLLWSQSRMAMIVFAIVVVGVLWQNRPDLRPWLAITSAVAAAMLPILGGDALLSRVTRTGANADLGTFNNRLPIWSHAVDRALEAPLTGTGFGSSSPVYDAFFLSGFFPIPATNTHSLVLEAFLTTGAVGVALLGAALVSYLRLRRHDRHPWRDGMLLLVTATGVTEASFGANYPSLGTLVVGAALGSIGAGATGAVSTWDDVRVATTRAFRRVGTVAPLVLIAALATERLATFLADDSETRHRIETELAVDRRTTESYGQSLSRHLEIGDQADLIADVAAAASVKDADVWSIDLLTRRWIDDLVLVRIEVLDEEDARPTLDATVDELLERSRTLVAQAALAESDEMERYLAVLDDRITADEERLDRLALTEIRSNDQRARVLRETEIRDLAELRKTRAWIQNQIDQLRHPDTRVALLEPVRSPSEPILIRSGRLRAIRLATVLFALAGLGYALARDRAPTRVER